MSAVSASSAASGSVMDPVRALQHALYRAAKADPERRFHALYDKVHGSDDSVEDIAVAARPRRCIRLGTSAVGIVVATNDVDVRLGALPARMMLDQMQIREPQTTETAHPDAAVMQPRDNHYVASRRQHPGLK